MTMRQEWRSSNQYFNSEEDLPQIFRELSERHARIELFSKDLAKQTNMANREVIFHNFIQLFNDLEDGSG